ncbi:MAG TPA: carboxymuconolactone decarboxylase family protein [Actinospica sp.]|jgi:AhpD family alkylhydroperoxidase|nr:carboxymuconolactone decarboxylase family protein [Actinospica sp.]
MTPRTTTNPPWITAVFEAVDTGGLPRELQQVVALRTSQINACAPSIHALTTRLHTEGDSPARIAAVETWQQAPYFDEAERAALDLAERTTQAVDEELWHRLSTHYADHQVAALVLLIGATAMVNRLNTISSPRSRQ